MRPAVLGKRITHGVGRITGGVSVRVGKQVHVRGDGRIPRVPRDTLNVFIDAACPRQGGAIGVRIEVRVQGPVDAGEGELSKGGATQACAPGSGKESLIEALSPKRLERRRMPSERLEHRRRKLEGIGRDADRGR